MATAPPSVTREQALAHRVGVQALLRPTAETADLDLWGLGIQESPAGSAALSVAARTPGGFDQVADLGDARSYATVWATRGAPLVLRSGSVPSFAAALWPADDREAVNRLAGNGQAFRKAGVDPIEAIRVTAGVLRDVVTEAMTKGQASTAVSAELPEAYITWCRSCEAHHLGDQLMRVASLPAGLRLVPGASVATLEPIGRWSGIPEHQEGAGDLVRSYLHLYGPAVPADVGTFLATTATAVKAVWPERLAEVRLDGRRAWLPQEDLEDLVDAEPVSGLVRLLPRSDPWLLGRDRKLIVPGKADRQVLWPTLGWPGAVLVDGEVRAAWRTRSRGDHLTISVERFTKLSRQVRDAIDEEATQVATSRGAEDLTVEVT